MPDDEFGDSVTGRKADDDVSCFIGLVVVGGWGLISEEAKDI